MFDSPHLDTTLHTLRVHPDQVQDKPQVFDLKAINVLFKFLV